MAFIAKTGTWKEVWMPATVSTVFAKNSLVTFTSGQLVAVTAGTVAVDVFGIIEKAVAAADSDYATARLLPIKIPMQRFGLVEADVTATLVTTDVGLEVDLTDASTVNRGATSVKAVKIVKFLTTTKALLWVKFSAGY